MLRLLLRLTARLLLGGSMLVARILVSSGCTSTVTPAATGAPPLVVLLRALVLLRTAATLRLLRLSRLLVQRVTGLESVGRTEAILERSGVVAGDQGVVARRFRDDCRVALLPSWVVRA